MQRFVKDIINSLIIGTIIFLVVLVILYATGAIDSGYALEEAWGGELFVPKIPSYRITDVAEAVGPECEKPVVGIRPGEKIHEEMITPSDSFYTYDLGKYYAILPVTHQWNLEEYLEKFQAKKVPQGFSYNSGENTEWETVQGLRELIKEHVDSTFAL